MKQRSNDTISELADEMISWIVKKVMKVGHYENEAMRKYTIYILSIFVVLLVACGEEKEENKTLDSFVIPKIIPYKFDSLVHPLIRFDSIIFRWGGPIEIHPFCEKIKIDTLRQKHASFYDYNLVNLYKNKKPLLDDSLSIVVDYNSVLPQRIPVKRFGLTTEKNFDERRFPVYIVNKASSTRQITTGYGKEIITVFEAMDENKEWFAISSLVDHGIYCGNGRRSIAYHLPQKHFMLLSYYPFYGDFKTKVRMRIKTGEHIYISNEFEANIKSSHFILTKEDAEFMFKDNDSSSVLNTYFLGARLRPQIKKNIKNDTLLIDSTETSFDGFYNSPIMQSTSAPDISMFPKRIREREYAHQAYMDKHYSTRDITEQQSRMRSFYLKEIDSVHKKLYNLLDEEGKQIITKQKRLFDATIQNEHKLFNYFHFHPNGVPGNNFGSAAHYTAYGFTLDALRSRYAELFAYTDFYESILKL